MARSHRTLQAVVVSTAAVLTAAVASGVAQAQTRSDVVRPVADKVSSDVLAQIESDGEAESWVRFEGAPDYTAAFEADVKVDKGAAAVKAAMEFAETSQARVADFLDESGVEYNSYWSSSTIAVTGDAELLAEIASFPEVLAITDSPVYELIEPVEIDVAPAAATWGVEDVNAPDVWDLGFDGTGITVASIDTGVEYDHPALVEQYRGNNGDGTFTHDYNFYDVRDVCGDEPCDLHGHGTHTMGTMVGDDGAGAQIGVAPGAEWIAVNGCCPNLGALLEAGEWIAAPTDSAGNNPDPSKAPEVVNNSWGTSIPIDDPFYEDVISLWHAAGIVPVFAIGNNGPFCNTAGSPGLYPNVIGVGAHDIRHDIAVFSSRGPGRDGDFKPDVTAPGVNVVSSLPGATYGSGSGTSVAAPHVSGAIALMMSADPALIGDYETVYESLTLSAIPVRNDQCGGTAKLNNVFGHGRTDAYAAVRESAVTELGGTGYFGATAASAPRLAGASEGR